MIFCISESALLVPLVSSTLRTDAVGTVLILSNVAVMAYVAFANAQKRRERLQAGSIDGGGDQGDPIDGSESLSDVGVLERKRLGDRHRDFDYSF